MEKLFKNLKTKIEIMPLKKDDLIANPIVQYIIIVEDRKNSIINR